MKIVIEFSRIWDKDDAHAIVGRAMGGAIDREDALEVTRSLSLTLSLRNAQME